MTISKSQRKLVYDRASDCCEYCRLPASASTVPFHIDHFIPLKHDGTNDLDNLCLSCAKCNAHKSHDLTGFDPETRTITPLFNPRMHIWREHFKIKPDSKLQGLTPIGRTTIHLMHMNDKSRLEYRQTLSELGEYPCNP